MTLKKVLAIMQIVCIVFLNVSHVRLAKADDSDIFGNNITPNVMILLDTSGSMGDEVGTLVAYAPAHHVHAHWSIAVSPSMRRRSTTRKTSGSVSGQGSCSSSNPCYTVYTTNCILNPTQSCSGVSSTSAKNALASSGTWSGIH